MSVPDRPRLGLAVSTIGRPALTVLLRSAAESSLPPAAVAVADQSGGRLVIDPAEYPFPVVVRPSSGGVSAGRNEAVAALPAEVDVVGFPNDDSWYPRTALEAVADRFRRVDPPDVVACSSDAMTQARRLPVRGTALDRYSVWTAVEPGLFVARPAYVKHGGFRVDLGTGSPSPWQSGEGTDLLLRMLAQGARIESAIDIEVSGPGERRELTADEWIRKLRRYARGTGYVYRIHPYPTRVRLRILIAPWGRLLKLHAHPPMALRSSFARSVGRLEGLLARPFPDPRGRHSRNQPGSEPERM